jgi:hypothetical protein
MTAARVLFLMIFALASLTGGVGVWMRLAPAAAATFLAGGLPQETPPAPRPGAVDRVLAALEASEGSYRLAAREAADPGERKVFREAARQRAFFAEEIRQVSLRYAGRPAPRRMPAEAATRQNAGALDAAAVSRYEEALKEDLPYEARAALESQLHSVKTAAEVLAAGKGGRS